LIENFESQALLIRKVEVETAALDIGGFLDVSDAGGVIAAGIKKEGG
jgi:hypothetical protein